MLAVQNKVAVRPMAASRRVAVKPVAQMKQASKASLAAAAAVVALSAAHPVRVVQNSYRIPVFRGSWGQCACLGRPGRSRLRATRRGRDRGVS